MVIDRSMGTGATAKNCMMDLQHRRFPPLWWWQCMCKNDDVIAGRGIVRKILNEASDMAENTEVENAAKLHLQNCTSARSGPTWIDLEIPKSILTVQCLALHVTHFVNQNCCDTDIHERVQHIPGTTWSDKWLARINGFGIETSLPQEYFT